MTTRNLLRLAALGMALLPASVAAQLPTPPAGLPPGSPPAADGQNPGGETPTERLQFGAWLDDATIEAPHSGRVGIGTGYWRTADGYHLNVPMLQASYGVTHRVQLAAFVPFYRARIGDDVTSGTDDIYLSAKVVASDVSAVARVGLAVSPALEILGAHADTAGKVHWALPISVELRRPATRAYASAGYFSRGAVFGGMAVEWTVGGSAVVWAALTHSYALRRSASSDSRHRLDAAIGLAKALTTRLSAYTSLGRTLSAGSAGRVSVGVVGGVAIAFSRRAVP